jgi:hypothetical protein
MYVNPDIKMDEEGEEPEAFIEQCRYIDLDGDGYKEPYLVTVHVDSKTVVRTVTQLPHGRCDGE